MKAKNGYTLEKELFEIPYQKDFILYAPLLRSVMLVNSQCVNFLCDVHDGKPIRSKDDIKVFSALLKHGIVRKNSKASVKDAQPTRLEKRKQEFLPTHLTLFLTSDCNLACKYCYGNAGEKAMHMPLETALAAVDLLFLNCAKTNGKRVHVGFHGGGEPLLRLATMKKIVEHARNLSRKRGIEVAFGLTTNGAMSPETCVWVAKTIDNLTVSFDGPKDIQNFQRPKRNGSASFEQVVRALRVLERFKTKYSIRATVSRYSQGRIDEIVTFITDNFSPTSIHVEPMFPSGRASDSGIEPPETEAFVQSFLAASRIADQRDVRFYFSGLRFPTISNAFCGIGLKNFSVTPDGIVTSCFEVLYKTDKRSNIFFIGAFNPGKGFIFDERKIAALNDLSLRELPFCKDCFAKFHCNGDCRAKVLYHSDVSHFKGTRRCRIIQELTKAKLIERLDLNGRN